MSLLLLFFEGGGDGQVDTGGGWLTEEQARAQIKRNRELERAENERRRLIKTKQRELEEAIREAYAKSTGKKVVREAIGQSAPVLPEGAEATVEVAADVANRLARVLEGTGRRFAAERKMAADLQRKIVELERLIQEADVRRQEEDNIAAMLLLAAV